MNYLPGLASNHDPPDLSLLSSWDYRREPQVPSLHSGFKNSKSFQRKGERRGFHVVEVMSGKSCCV
jgi:hypothetical protein